MRVFAVCVAGFLYINPATAQVKTTAAESRPELVVQTGHTWRLETLAFSNDSRLIASTSGPRGDGTVKLWEVSTRRQLRTMAGHAGGVNAIAFSPDGHWLASGGEDDTIRIWEVVTGLESHRFYVPSEGVNVLLFSPDSRYLVSLPELSPYIGRDREPSQALQQCPNVKDKPGFCEAKDLSVWNVASGRFLFNIPPPVKKCSGPSENCHFPDRHWQVAFTPDGTLLAVGVDANEMQLWDLAEARQTPTLAGSASPFVFDSSGRHVASASMNGGVVLWDLATRSESVKIKAAGKPVALANHDTRLITRSGAEGSEVIQTWDTADGHEVQSFSPDPIFDCANCSLHFSDNGRWVARGGYGEPKVILWDLAAPGKRPRTWRDLNAPIEFSPDGRWLAANTASFFDRNIPANNIWLLDLESTEQSCASASPLRKIGAVAVSSKPARLATASGGAVDLWDLATGVRLKTLPGGDESISALAFSPDGRWLVSGYWPSNEAVTWFPRMASSGIVAPSVDWAEPQCLATQAESEPNSERNETGAVWDMMTLRAYRDWPQMHAPIAVSPDSKQVANAYEGAIVNLWNLSDKTGTQLKLDSQSGRLVASGETLVRALAFGSRHRWLATAMDGESSIAVWDLDKRHRVATLTTRPQNSKNTRVDNSERYQVSASSNVIALAFNPISDVLASASEDGIVRQWNVADAKEISSFHVDVSYRATLAFGTDGGQLAVTAGNRVARWDVNRGVRLPDLEGQPNAVSGLAFNDDGRLLLTGSDDGTTRVWDTHSGELLATLIAASSGNDWLVVTPQGLFDGTAAGWKQILWRFDRNTFNYAPVESYFNDFFHPGLLQEIFQGKRPTPPDGKELAKRDRRRPIVKLESGDAQNSSSSAQENSTNDNRNITIRLEVTENVDKPGDPTQPKSGGARDVRLFRNGSLVKLWRGDAFDKRSGCVSAAPRKAVIPAGPRTAVCTAEVPIVSGDNEFTAYAFNHDNLKSDEAKPLLIKGDKSLERKGVLYVLAIGINHYQTKGYELNFAVADVDEIAMEFQTRQRQLRNYPDTEIISLHNEQATRNNILLALRRFADPQNVKVPENAPSEIRRELEKIKDIKPEDSLVIYFSGHGANRDEHFFLLPHDFRKGTLKSSSISDVELNEVLERVGAGNILMVIDACQSGQALGGEKEGRGPMNSKGLAQLAYDKGMYILTASQSYQAAQEISRTQSGKRIEHGLLTFALLEGLTKANKDNEGNISEREWMNYAVEQVPLMQTEEMKKRSLENKARWGSGKRGLEIVFDAGDKEADPVKRNVQRPRVFYRRELEARPLIVARQ